jgi:uncharacterized protein (TIGR00661 family)
LQKTILYAVLNWGLGHVTRSIPIIRYLNDQGHRVILVSDGIALDLLTKEFPDQTIVATNSYAVSYASNAATFNIELALQIPKFMRAIKEEQSHCKALCEEYGVDCIISDNRYGFYQKTIPSAFICHQLHLLYPGNRLIEKIVNKSYQGYLNKFSQLWVPDINPPNNLSGQMSDLSWKNVHYIGIESRFKHQAQAVKYDSISILSGPEPQRTLLEEELLKKLHELNGKHCLVRGSGEVDWKENQDIHVVHLATSELLNQLINESALVICRAGYTSVMDLIKLQKSAILIPTPGQAEQEYLASSLADKEWFQQSTQGELLLEVDTKFEVPDLDTGYHFEIIRQFLSSSVSLGSDL